MFLKRFSLVLLLVVLTLWLFACDQITTTTTTIETTQTTTTVTNITSETTTVVTTQPTTTEASTTISTTEMTVPVTTMTTVITTTETTEPVTTEVLTTTVVTTETTTTAVTTEPTTTAATTTEETTQSIQELLINAANRIIISDADNMTSNFVLPAEAANDTTVTWSSSHPEYLAIATTVSQTLEGFFVYQATVTRPSETIGNVLVTLTGTFEYGDESYVKNYPILVKATFGLTTYSSISELRENAVLNDLVTTAGIVYSKYAYGYFIQDASGAYLNIYTSATEAALVSLGDEVRVTGNYALYHNLYQVTDLTEQVIVNSNNPVVVEPIVLADAKDLLLIDPDNTLLNGQTYRITVIPELLTQGTFQNIYLFADGVRVATVYYGSLSDAKLALSTYVGTKVTIDVVYYTYYESGSSILDPAIPEIWVTFEGAEADITPEEMSDAEKLAMDVGKLPDSYSVTTELLLPELTFAQYTDFVISTEISAYLSYGYSLGEFVVVRPESDVSGTLTVSLEYNQIVETVVIPVVMKAPTVFVPGDDIFISEYIEGSSYNKFIEIFNPLDTSVNLSEYTLELFSNGATANPYTMTLTGTLTSGDVVVYSNTQASTVIFIAADYTNSSVINFNGNDVVVLKHNGVIIDSIGQLGLTTDFAINVTLVRKATITGGDTDPTDAYDVSSQWDTYPIDTATYLGAHTMN